MCCPWCVWKPIPISLYTQSYAPFSPFFSILDNYFKFMGLQLSSYLSTTYPEAFVYTFSDFCTHCGSDIFPETLKSTGTKCAPCRDKDATYIRKSWCIAPISNKAAYTLITDISLLKQINPKRTEV